MALGLLASAMYISCIFHVVCASFSALATRKLADAEANSSGIWALVLRYIFLIVIAAMYIAGELENIPLWVAERPHSCNF